MSVERVENEKPKQHASFFKKKKKEKRKGAPLETEDGEMAVADERM